MACTVTETLNGEWELTLTHPIDDAGKWTRIAEGNILRAPVPAAMTPRVDLVTQQYQTTTYDVQVYKITTKSGPLRLRSGTGTKYKILGKYKKGKEVIVLDKTTSDWYEVTAPDGKHGYMSSQTYDCLTRKYTSVTLGTVADTLEGATISARQLASGSITGAKLALDSVGAGQLQNGSVGSLQVKMAAIQTAHIRDAAITTAKIAEATIGELNATASFTSNTLNTAGSLTLTATVTDSRGRTASASRTMTVLAYSPPSLAKFTAERCSSDGSSAQTDGTKVRITAKASASSVGGKNSLSCTIYYKTSSASAWTQATTVSHSNYAITATNLPLARPVAG